MEVRETPKARALRLAQRGVEYAKAGRKRDGEIAFKKAFEAVRGMESQFGTPENDVYERSELASGLAEEVVEAGLSASFAIRMWTLGCNADVLRDEKGHTSMVYPLDIMEMAAQEMHGKEDEGVPPVACKVEEEKGILAELVSAARQLPGLGLLFGEEGEHGEAGKDERR